MKKWAYYNEKDPHCCEWIRNLMRAGEITDGEIDSRSILDVDPADVAGFRRCHWFSGIAVWDRALRDARWSEDREVWTGSCPCQPLSAAGQRKGHVDERHLWPSFHNLIAERRPATILGEQVASKDGREWMAAVRHDLEASGYAVGCAVLPAAGFGAPHLRYRMFFVAHATGERQEHGDVRRSGEGVREAACWGTEQVGVACPSGFVAHAGCERGQHLGHDLGETTRGNKGSTQQRQRLRPDDRSGGATGRVADAAGHQEHQEQQRPAADEGRRRPDGFGGRRMADLERPCPPDSFWSDADWLFCRDNRWRPVEPGTFPLVDGSAFHLGSGGPYEGQSRAGMLRGYGNAIVLPVARAFVEACLEAIECLEQLQ